MNEFPSLQQAPPQAPPQSFQQHPGGSTGFPEQSAQGEHSLPPAGNDGAHSDEHIAPQDGAGGFPNQSVPPPAGTFGVTAGGLAPQAGVAPSDGQAQGFDQVALDPNGMQGVPIPEGKCAGTATRWNDRGFGFIKPADGSEDVFCHFRSILDGNMLAEGSMVYYERVYDESRQKWRAEQVTGGIQGERGTGSGGGFRTGVCYDFLQNRCTRGESCRYAHEAGGGGFQGGYGGRRVAYCFDFQRGRCMCRRVQTQSSSGADPRNGPLRPAPPYFRHSQVPVATAVAMHMWPVMVLMVEAAVATAAATAAATAVAATAVATAAATAVATAVALTRAPPTLTPKRRAATLRRAAMAGQATAEERAMAYGGQQAYAGQPYGGAYQANQGGYGGGTAYWTATAVAPDVEQE